ncbi:hypothetical protein HP436_08500 [Pseudomonas sp. CrR14]|nr:hypothetical protein [Pseudomonas sp. CrR14]
MRNPCKAVTTLGHGNTLGLQSPNVTVLCIIRSLTMSGKPGNDGRREIVYRHRRRCWILDVENGAASLIDVLNADETLLQASDARANAETESARAAIAAFRALGSGRRQAT